MSDIETPFKGMSLVDHGIEAGIQWVTTSAPLYGAVNGYVKIPEGHPWHGRDYDEIDVAVHGGLTYGNRSGWIGFDTLHGGDNWPGSPRILPLSRFDIEWTPELVAVETRRLAHAVAEAAT